MDTVTEGFGCLVVNNLSRSNKLEDCVFWYEAEIHPSYTIGSREYWQKHNELVKDEDDDHDCEELFDPVTYHAAKKKNSPNLKVRKLVR
jgi:hypothetical protein